MLFKRWLKLKNLLRVQCKFHRHYIVLIDLVDHNNLAPGPWDKWRGASMEALLVAESWLNSYKIKRLPHNGLDWKEVKETHSKKHSLHTTCYPSKTECLIIILRLWQTPYTTTYVVASLPRMKGPALLALLPDIPGHCSLLALPDVSPAPLSDERRLDILELCRKINQITVRDKDSQVKG